MASKRKNQPVGKCGDCRHYELSVEACQLMAACHNELCLIKQRPETHCVIGKFEPRVEGAEQAERNAASQAQVGLEGMEPAWEIVGLREFARANSVELGSIQDAIDAGRISEAAVCLVKQGGRMVRKLYRVQAQADWDRVHAAPTLGLTDEELQASGLTPEEIEEAKSAESSGVKWGVYKTREEALLAKARRKAIEKQNLENDGELHRACDVLLVCGEIESALRTRMLGVPAKIAPIIAALPDRQPAQIQSIIDQAIREALGKSSFYNRDKITAEARRRMGKTDVGSS